MNNFIAFVMIGMLVLGLGVATLATAPTPVSADQCGGQGEPPCTDICELDPDLPECQDPPPGE